MYIFGVICARGGSKGMPGKNICPLGGKSLISWSVESSRQSKLLNRTIVSTDCEKIATAARHAGGDVPFLRPSELAQDNSSIVDAVIHAVQWLKQTENISPDIILLLQVCSPFRTGREIDETIRLVTENDCNSAQTVTQDRHHPYYKFQRAINGELIPWREGMLDGSTNRQSSPQVFQPTGSVYAVRHDILMKKKKLVSDRHRGLLTDERFSIDIDTAWDFQIAEWIVRDGLHLNR